MVGNVERIAAAAAAAAGRRWDCPAAAGIEVVHRGEPLTERVVMMHGIHRTLLLLDIPR